VTTGSFSGSPAGSATSAASLTGALAGDVTGSQSATVVANVGGVPTASVASGTNLANEFSVGTLPDDPNSRLQFRIEPVPGQPLQKRFIFRRQNRHHPWHGCPVGSAAGFGHFRQWQRADGHRSERPGCPPLLFLEVTKP
jgi:hypothetical protein